MFLNRVRVPNFRVLKDVDITFEKEFNRSIFPLGSQNGGGKSTLLQLIFVLLHCSTKPERLPFLQNILSGFNMEKNTDESCLAIFTILDGDKNVELEFLVKRSSWFFTNLTKMKLDKYNNLSQINQKLRTLSTNFNTLKLEQGMIQQREIEKPFVTFVEKVNEYLNQNGIFYVTEYRSQSQQEENVLLCKITNLELAKTKSFLDRLSEKIFLAAPSTQIFLFLSEQNRKLLFKQNEQNKQNNNSYSSSIVEAQSKLIGLFAYDFLAVNFIMEMLKNAMSMDINTIAETEEYGNHCKDLLNNINYILSSAKLSVLPDFSGVKFIIKRDNQIVELNPEDFSHGELKRLSIYIWLKYRKIEDGIVLIDEIENAFHPDWQYEIIRDLIEWTPTNQYILATHSYELCTALTPGHVKQLEPKLLPQK